MNTHFKHAGILLAVMLLFSACNYPFQPAQPTEAPVDVVATSVAMIMQTFEAEQQLTQAAAAAQPSATFTPPVMQTSTPQATTALMGTPTVGSCLQSIFISETIPDGSYYSYNQGFTKTWTIRNTGTCTWEPTYKLMFVSGEQMSGPNEVLLGKTVAPNADVTLSVPLKAPSWEGDFTGVWALRSDAGLSVFENLTVAISSSVNAFRISSVSFNDVDDQDECPVTFNFDITFTATAAGEMEYTVYYYKDGAFGSAATTVHRLSFSSASTKTVTLPFIASVITNGGLGKYAVKVYIAKPNNQWFGPDGFRVTDPDDGTC